MTDAYAERSQVRFGTKTIDYKIERSSRRGTVSIAVDPAQGVLVTAPQPASVRRLDDIVHANALWIVERLKRRSDLPPPMPAKEFVSGETFLYLGRHHRLRLDLDQAPGPLRLDKGWLRIAIPPMLEEHHRSQFVRAALLDWYRAKAARRLSERVKEWSDKLRIQEPELLMVEPKKRWGSASVSGTVRINWRIIQAPLSLVDYVVAHELVHLQHPNHTRDFWAALGRVMPDYESRKARLRGIGSKFEW
jgi:predicted metal-dependent hydrolase